VPSRRMRRRDCREEVASWKNLLRLQPLLAKSVHVSLLVSAAAFGRTQQFQQVPAMRNDVGIQDLEARRPDCLLEQGMHIRSANHGRRKTRIVPDWQQTGANNFEGRCIASPFRLCGYFPDTAFHRLALRSSTDGCAPHSEIILKRCADHLAAPHD